MTRALALLALLVVTGCASTQAPDGCAYWKNKPWSASQSAWRHMDCPAEYPYPYP